MTINYSYYLYLKSSYLVIGESLEEILQNFLGSNGEEKTEFKELLERSVDNCEALGDEVIEVDVFACPFDLKNEIVELLEGLEIPFTLELIQDESSYCLCFEGGLEVHKNCAYYLELVRDEPYYACTEFVEDSRGVLKRILAVFPKAIEVILREFDSLENSDLIVKWLSNSLAEEPCVGCEFILVAERMLEHWQLN